MINIMTEQFRPQPENPKQNAPEAGAGPLGLPPPSPGGERSRGELTLEQRQNSPQVGDGSRGSLDQQRKQTPQGGSGDKQEFHPSKNSPLALEPNLPSHDQQLGNLDPEIEEMIR